MKCQNCEHQNLEGAAFCGLCGIALESEGESRENPPLASPVFKYQMPVAQMDATLALDNFCCAGVWRRFFATWLDNIGVGIVMIPFVLTPFGRSVMMRMRGSGSLDIETKIQLALLAFSIVLAYGTFFMGKFGGTPGQRMLGMKTLFDSMDGPKELGYKKAFLRAFVYQVLNIIPIINFFVTIVSTFTVIFTAKHQAIHDMICKTVVVKDRPTM